MSRQNRLNAGAELVLCRIWATLLEGARGDAHAGSDQDAPQRIHAESLLACLGAFAGYACQAQVRRAATFSTLTVADGARYFDSDALQPLLTGGPLSLWALVSRTTQKFGVPLPQIDEISRHVGTSLGTREFGVPRVPAGHRPRHLPAAYLKHLWPQIVPLAQPFCHRPAQLPVLFGIALQRAIELTHGRVDPALGASIAMECAIAMSRVSLPELEAAPVAAQVTAGGAALPIGASGVPGRGKDVRPASSRESGFSAASKRKKRPADVDAEATPRFLHVGLLAERLAPVRNILTIMSLAIVAMAGTILSVDRGEAPKTARAAPIALVQGPALPRESEPVLEEELAAESLPVEETQSVVAFNEPPAEEVALPMPEQPTNEGIISEEGQDAFASPGGGMMSSAFDAES